MILCPICQADLLPIPENTNLTTCSKCEHPWELNEDHTAVKSVTIAIEKITMPMGVKDK